jgi:hypothetical protein
MMLEKTGYVYIYLKLDPCLSPCTKISSKWIKDLKVRPETLKLPRKTVEDTGICNYFLNKTPFVQEIRERIDKWYCIKFKNIYM